MCEVLREIEQGKLMGTTGKDYHGGKFFKFMGIPYAKAPVRDLRFKAPQEPDSWADIRDATNEGPECPSPDMFFGYYIGNEDNCLNLNVYTKELPQDTVPLKKPVMVWIHGGAFTTGSNKTAMYGPEYLMTQDIVLVTINYRLGILGFASFKDKSLDVPGNAGLKDQRMALKWVKRNIKEFGGDPDNVTIFGESAGGASVHYLTLSPTTKGLFHKAIMQSGTALNNWAWGKNNSSEIARVMGYKDADENIILEKLRRESAKTIVNGQMKLKEDFAAGNIRPWGPVVEPPSEDAFLTEHPQDIMHARGGPEIPMIIGYNSGEGIFFELVRRSVPGIRLPHSLVDEIPFELKLGKDTEECKKAAEKVKEAYFGDKEINENNIDILYKVKGDTNFIYSIQKSMKLQAKHSHQPIYAYRMSLVSSLNYFHKFSTSKYFKTTMLCTFLSKLSSRYLPLAKISFVALLSTLPRKDMNGVVHADDLTYLWTTFFTHPIRQGSSEDLYIQRFVKLWTNFAKHGEPTPEPDKKLNDVKWKPVTTDNIQFLDIAEEIKLIGNVDEERLKVWDEIYESHLQIPS